MMENQENKSIVPIEEGRGLVPKDLDGLWRLCDVISRTDLVPESCKGKPENVFIRAQFGMEIGLSFMASLQNVSNIKGNPSLWGDAPLGIVRASGKLESFLEEEIGQYPEKDYGWMCTVKRSDDTTLTIRKFTVEDAITAGNWFYEGGRKANEKEQFTPWYRYPKRMLQMRARSWALRDSFPDYLKGVRIQEEYEGDVQMAETSPGQYEPEESTHDLEKKITGEFEKKSPAVNPWWHRENWAKLRAPGYKDFYNDNLYRMHECPSDIMIEMSDKYLRLYKEEAPTAPQEGIQAEVVYDPANKDNTIITPAEMEAAIKKEAVESLIEANGNGKSSIDDERATLISLNAGLENDYKQYWADAYLHCFDRHIDFFTGYEVLSSQEISTWNDSIMKAIDFEESNGR